MSRTPPRPDMLQGCLTQTERPNCLRQGDHFAAPRFVLATISQNALQTGHGYAGWLATPSNKSHGPERGCAGDTSMKETLGLLIEV